MSEGKTTDAAASLRWESVPISGSAIDAIEQAWTDLSQHAVERNVFLFPWFVRAALPLLAKEKPNLVTIYDGPLLIGALLVHEDCGYAKLPFSFVRSASHNHQFLQTPLVRKGSEEQFARGLCSWLDDQPAKNCFLLLTHLSGDTPIARQIERVCAEQKSASLQVDQYPRAGIKPRPLTDNPADTHISSKRLKNLRRKRRRLSQNGEVAVELLSKDADLEPWLEDFLRLENMGWKKEQGTSIKSSEKETAFYRDLLASAHEAGALRLFRLTVGGRAIAYALDMVSGPHAYCLKCAYDPEYKNYSPGVQMEYEALQHYQKSGTVEFVDSCAATENDVLNSLWPDRKSIITIAISRTGVSSAVQFAMMRLLLTGSDMLKNIRTSPSEQNASPKR